jgi:hypothetical protein
MNVNIYHVHFPAAGAPLVEGASTAVSIEAASDLIVVQSHELEFARAGRG